MVGIFLTNEAAKRNNKTIAICPASTPKLKPSKAETILSSGKPTSARVPANPKPCARPNKAVTPKDKLELLKLLLKLKYETVKSTIPNSPIR